MVLLLLLEGTLLLPLLAVDPLLSEGAAAAVAALLELPTGALLAWTVSSVLEALARLARMTSSFAASSRSEALTRVKERDFVAHAPPCDVACMREPRGSSVCELV